MSYLRVPNRTNTHNLHPAPLSQAMQGEGQSAHNRARRWGEGLGVRSFLRTKNNSPVFARAGFDGAWVVALLVVAGPSVAAVAGFKVEGDFALWVVALGADT